MIESKKKKRIYWGWQFLTYILCNSAIEPNCAGTIEWARVRDLLWNYHYFINSSEGIDSVQKKWGNLLQLSKIR